MDFRGQPGDADAIVLRRRGDRSVGGKRAHEAFLLTGLIGCSPVSIARAIPGPETRDTPGAPLGNRSEIKSLDGRGGAIRLGFGRRIREPDVAGRTRPSVANLDGTS